MPAIVTSVQRSALHDFSKQAETAIRLIAGLGIEGDAHCGRTVQHRSRVARNPDQPNLRQVHLVHAELFADLAEAGFAIRPGDIGENVTTEGIDLLGLPRGARLLIGKEAVIEITGLRNPCHQLDDFQAGLMKATLGRDREGGLIRKAGVMAVVVESGIVRPGDPIGLELPPGPHQPLMPV